ncbi:pilus retraction ATPase PilT [Limimonas halophila]|uniref:Pilus retraction ATPase PilT n=1 Tax=Limimonas halophila TaxID=1082479 RepID=A0A1G7NNV5_9PROT|nr:PilT/PilU family type 4a pilus ATPase [Limimonas halophila]SDF75672.1 pilus retraction ATPase PilT [Limimonas halophila]
MSTGNNVLDLLLERARTSGVSDIHIAAGHRPLMRLEGRLEPMDHPALDESAVRGVRESLLAAGSGNVLGEDTDMDFARTLNDGERYRINAYQTLNGSALAIRRLPTAPPPLEDLPAPAVVRDLGERESGLILVTGPTGSGKSTTLAALIDRINTSRRQHIITIEDPIEYVHPHKESLINQREVGRHTASFHTALRGALREDPDVVLVGEMRDLETISLALTAAETGQLVLASMHTPTAPQAIDRILDVFPGQEKELIRSMLSTALTAVVTQRLLPAQGGGRAAAMEVMLGTSAVRNQIREGKIPQLHQSMELGQQAGMRTMSQAIQALADTNYIDGQTASDWSAAFDGTRGQDGQATKPQSDAANAEPASRRRGSVSRSF